MAVVGGGISGLAAAWELVHPSEPGVAPLAGADVVVLEASPRFGGIVTTTPFAGHQVDEAADSLLARVPWGVQLCEELGLGPELVSPAARTAYVWHAGALHPLPAGHVLGVPTDLDAAEATGLLSPGERARAEHDLAGEAPLLEADRPIGEVVRERLGDAVAERLVDPLVGGINAGDSDHLSIEAVTPQLAAAARSDRSLVRALRAQRAAATADPDAPVFHSHPEGLGHVVEVLVERLRAAGVDLRADAAVSAIEPRGGAWSVAAATGSMDVDAVVLALPAAPAAALLSPLSRGAADLLGAVEHASVAIVTLAVPTEALGRPLDASGHLVPRGAGTTLTACSWASAKWAHLADERQAILRASAGRAGDPSALDLDDDALVGQLLADLATTMDLRGDPTEVRVSRWPASLPQYRTGHVQRVARIEAAAAADAPGVHLAGNALHGLGVPACIHQGRTAAAQARTRVADGSRR